jgi:hypothetical protein
VEMEGLIVDGFDGEVGILLVVDEKLDVLL